MCTLIIFSQFFSAFSYFHQVIPREPEDDIVKKCVKATHVDFCNTKFLSVFEL